MRSKQDGGASVLLAGALALALFLGSVSFAVQYHRLNHYRPGMWVEFTPPVECPACLGDNGSRVVRGAYLPWKSLKRIFARAGRDA